MSTNGTGRSPYTARSRRRPHLQFDTSSSAMDETSISHSASNLSPHNGNSSSNIHHSTNSTRGTHSNNNYPAYQFGESAVQARISPAWSTWSERKSRFFDSDRKAGKYSTDGGVLATGIPLAVNGNGQSSSKPKKLSPVYAQTTTSAKHQTSEKVKPIPGKTNVDRAGTASSALATEIATASTGILDGIDTENLRTLARECMGSNSSLVAPSTAMGVSFASLLCAKTSLPEDTFLYAQALFSNGEAKRCIRLLEQTRFLSSAPHLRLEAVLLAAQAFASMGDWHTVMKLLEDASGFTGGNEKSNWVPKLQDDDDIAWQSFAQSTYRDENDDCIHPVSRLCLTRGYAYSETDHPLRAALYWKRALTIDSRCVQALDCLLDRSVISSREVYDFVKGLRFESGKDWMRSLYLARINISPQQDVQAHDGKKPVGLNGLTVKTSFMNGHDASTIDFATTPSFQNQGEMSIDGNTLLGISYAADASKTPGPSKVMDGSTMQQDIDDAFHKLWNVHKLQNSSEVLAMAARRAYRRYKLTETLDYCEQLAEIDPLCQTAGFVYISTLVALGHKRTLFRVAHEWVEASPKSARAWFAVGAYYYACERYHVAQRHFCRATRLDSQCSEAWIAFGCSFAACDESDQALASFRAAQRLAPGEHSCMLYIGMEYLRTNHMSLAQHFLTSAYKVSGGDPICSNEVGVLAYQQRDYHSAIGWLLRAVRSSATDNQDCTDPGEIVETCQDAYWEPTLFNLGQAYRKLRQFDKAIQCFTRCLALRPNNASSYSALGFTNHLIGNINEAIGYYHQSLCRKPEDPFSKEMLNRALQDALRLSLFLDDPSKEIIGPDGVGFAKPLLARTVRAAPRDSLMDEGPSSMAEDSDVDMSLS